MGGGRAAFAGVVLVLLASGCLSEGQLDDGPHPFSPIDAPEWEPGYFWNYQSTLKITGLGASFRSERTETSKVLVRVLNTTHQIDGRPVNVLRIEGDRQGAPFWSDELVALTQDHLEEIAAGYAARPPWGGCSSHEGPTLWTRAQTGFPGLRFPLDDGQTWEGRVDSGPAPLTYTAHVLGFETVTVPAGAFGAVHIRLTFGPTLATSPARYDPSGAFSVTGDVWYSPEARYVAKAVVNFVQTPVSPAARTQNYEYTLALDTYVHKARRPDPAPSTVNGSIEASHLTVVSNTAGPFDVSAGPKAGVFSFLVTPKPAIHGLRDYEDDVYPHARTEPVVVKAFTAPDYDRSRYVPRWQLIGYHARTLATIDDVLHVEFTDATTVGVRVTLQDRNCPHMTAAHGQAFVDAFWTRTFEVDPPAGSSALEFDVVRLPVAQLGMGLNVTWRPRVDPSDRLEAVREPLPLRDGGQPIVKNDRGQELPAAGQDYKLYRELPIGNLDLRWRAERPAAGFGPMPVLLGNKFEVTATLSPVRCLDPC